MNKPERWAKQAHTIRAELVGDDGCHCAVAGLYACASTPVLEMCRLLVSAGYDPGSKLLCFRGGVLSLTVHSIGEATRLKVNSKGTGFERVSGVRMGPPMRNPGSAGISARNKSRANGRTPRRERRTGRKRAVA
jgi:hypothetical protein